MTLTLSWRALATIGATVVSVGACGDGATAPGNTSGGRHDGEQLYLIDNQCISNNPAIDCQETNGSVIFTVALSGTTGANTLWRNLTGHCATDPSVYCDLWYDQAHIGASPDGSRIYAVNRRQVPGGGNPIGYVDVATKDFVHLGQISGIATPDGVVMAAFSPVGELFLGDQDDDRLYRVDPSTLAVTASWTISRPTGPGALDLDGGDLAFDAAGVLYLYTNAEHTPADRGLYRITITGDAATSTRIGAHTDLLFTGMAVRDSGTGNLVLSNADTDRYYEIERTTGAVVASFRMTGALTDHVFGDMTVGRLTPGP